MAFDLRGHWERQAFNAYLLQTFDDKKAYELFPTYPKDGSTVIQPNELNIASSFEDVVLPDEFNGSNNWVVDGDKTASGKPLLADDPHLGLSTPSIWYEMSLQSNDVNVAGVIFAGVPGIILGHNEDVRSEEHTSELQSRGHLVCRLLLEKKKNKNTLNMPSHSTDLPDPKDWINPKANKNIREIIRKDMPAFDPQKTPTHDLTVIPKLCIT